MCGLGGRQSGEEGWRRAVISVYVYVRGRRYLCATTIDTLGNLSSQCHHRRRVPPSHHTAMHLTHNSCITPCNLQPTGATIPAGGRGRGALRGARQLHLHHRHDGKRLTAVCLVRACIRLRCILRLTLSALPPHMYVHTTQPPNLKSSRTLACPHTLQLNTNAIHQFFRALLKDD